MPIRMKPMIGLIRILAKAGITIPAAPRISSASLNPDVATLPAMARLCPFLPNGGRCWRHDVKTRPGHRRRRSGGRDGGAAVRPGRMQGASVGEARGLLPGFPRGHRAPFDAGAAPRAWALRRVPKA